MSLNSEQGKEIENLKLRSLIEKLINFDFEHLNTIKMIRTTNNINI